MLSPKYSDFFKYLLNFGSGQSDYLINLIIFDRSIDPLFIELQKG